MQTSEIDILEEQIVVEILEHQPNEVITRTIMNKSTGNISIVSFADGQGLVAITSPFATYAQIIEGNAEIVIDKESHLLLTGRSIVIPAFARNFIRPNWQFKMILTVLKNGLK